MKYINDRDKLDPATNYLVLVRHGQSMGNAWDPAYKNPEMNFLTELGEAQVRLSGIKLRATGMRFNTMISSRITRARHTLAILAHTIGDWQREFILDNRFNERIPTNATFGPGEEETPEVDHRTTVKDGFESVVRPALAQGNVLLVSHYYTMKVLFEHLAVKYGLSLSKLWGGTDHIPNAIPFIYDITDPFGKVVVLNDETRVPSY